jgi:hypothetical protein
MATANLTSAIRIKPRLSIGKLPVNLFGAVMGLAGLALAWRQAGAILGVDQRIGEAIGAVAVIAFAAIAAGYIAKGIRHPSAVAEEFLHPVTGTVRRALVGCELPDGRTVDRRAQICSRARGMGSPCSSRRTADGPHRCHRGAFRADRDHPVQRQASRDRLNAGATGSLRNPCSYEKRSICFIVSCQ